MPDENRSESSRGGYDGARGREGERGDAAEPDAPTSVEPNEALGTILSADQPLGVQGGTSEEPGSSG